MAFDHPHTSALPDTQSIKMPRPKQPRPILVIGAGGIVRAAHLPAYAMAGFPVIGIMDENAERATSLATERGIPNAFSTIAEAVRFAPDDVIFDVAVPASQLVHILPQLKDGTAVLMQKPMGETLAEAAAIREICRNKGLTASVNFSLRYSPNNLAVQALADAGMIGAIHDVEVQTSTFTPWHLWTFLATAPRLEILYHSIHYFDLIRSWLGNPRSVSAKTVKSPHAAGLAATKTVAILDYGDAMRVFVATNHSHEFGEAHQHSFVQFEGLHGAARMTMGVNLDYPTGRPDTVEYARRGAGEASWTSVPIQGNNFPDGFMGPMGALQAYVEGSAASLPTHFEDAYETMALVEALYRSSDNGAAYVSFKDDI
ncbi:Gfo/Idh/MocA family protein [Acidicapsa ligni]|uniref:Gfo/Idh/MocA family protein n=1 Tax=Acidicapsa ligni TaxID=542300 RepID=UPI0021E0C632|nr:Gfo/Idh/MocA family oxidoreductase [Acidicapsa ligni]